MIIYPTVHDKLHDISLLAVTDGNFIVGNGTTWVAESGNTARTSLGLGTGDSPTLTGLTVGNLTFSYNDINSDDGTIDILDDLKMSPGKKIYTRSEADLSLEAGIGGSIILTTTGVGDVRLDSGDDIYITCGDVIRVRPSGDEGDYLLFKTVDDVPEITSYGTCELKISNSLGTPRSVTVSEMEDAHDHLTGAVHTELDAWIDDVTLSDGGAITVASATISGHTLVSGAGGIYVGAGGLISSLGTINVMDDLDLQGDENITNVALFSGGQLTIDNIDLNGNTFTLTGATTLDCSATLTLDSTNNIVLLAADEVHVKAGGDIDDYLLLTTVDHVPTINTFGGCNLEIRADTGHSVVFGSAIDFQNKDMTNVDIDSGTIDNTTIGGVTPAAGTFSSVSIDATADHTITNSSDDLVFTNPNSDGDVIWNINDGGTQKNFLTLDGSASSMTLAAGTLDLTNVLYLTATNTTVGVGASSGMRFALTQTGTQPTYALYGAVGLNNNAGATSCLGAYFSVVDDTTNPTNNHTKKCILLENTPETTFQGGTHYDYGLDINVKGLMTLPQDNYAVSYTQTGIRINRDAIQIYDTLGSWTGDVATYGLYIEGWGDATDVVSGVGGTYSDYAIYTDGGDEIHAGNIRIGSTTAPTVALDVDGTVKIKERAAAETDTAAYGQDWIKNTTPCERWFTDDTGVDYKLGGPKEHFFDVHYDDATYSRWRVRRLTDGLSAYTTFIVPADFNAIVSAELIVIPRCAEAAADWNIASAYAAIGEDRQANEEADGATTYDVSGGEEDDLYAIDISGIYSSLAAGDFCSAIVTVGTAGHNVDVLGVRFKYR